MVLDMSTLIIRHTGGGGDGASFHVERLTDGKRTKPVDIDSPVGFPVEGRPHSGLIRELRWYLEWFLDYPFEPVTEHAERVLKSLRNWGRQTFNALFDSRQGGEFLKDALDGGHYDRLHLQVSSDDPGILAWPWEALEDPAAGLLAQTCQIDRRLNEVVDPPDLDENLGSVVDAPDDRSPRRIKLTRACRAASFYECSTAGRRRRRPNRGAKESERTDAR